MFEKYIASGYINCLKRYFSYDRRTIDSMAFLIMVKRDSSLYVFRPEDDAIVYDEQLTGDELECSKYVQVFKKYNPETIRSLSSKLWRYFIREPVQFDNDERKLMNELGLRNA